MRVLTQESQRGEGFAVFGAKRPNVMVLGHGDWLDGLVAKARGVEVGETKSGSVGVGGAGAGE